MLPEQCSTFEKQAAGGDAGVSRKQKVPVQMVASRIAIYEESLASLGVILVEGKIVNEADRRVATNWLRILRRAKSKDWQFT